MPAKKLTDRAITTLPRMPDEAQTDYFDTGCPGLVLRVGARSRRWCLHYHFAGKPARWTFGRAGDEAATDASGTGLPRLGLSEARQRAIQALERAQQGVDPRNPTGTVAGTVEAVVADWLAKDQSNRKTIGEVTRIMDAYVLPAWSGRRFQDIKKRDVLNLYDAHVTRAPIQANRILTRTKRLFAWASEQDIIDADPARSVKRNENLAPENERDRHLSDAELAMVCQSSLTLGYPHGHAALVVLMTGTRRGEIYGLRRNEVRHRHIVLKPDRFKGQKGKQPPERYIALPLPAWRLIKHAMAQHSGEFVFSEGDGSRPAQNFSRNMKLIRGMVNHFVMHDFRRCSATFLEANGHRPDLIELWQGRVKEGVRRRYQLYKHVDQFKMFSNSWARHLLRVHGEAFRQRVHAKY